MKLKIISVLLLLSLLAVTVSAEETYEMDYVAFGDSIARGYGLQDANTEGYVALVGASLKTAWANYSVNGMTSSGLLHRLEEIENSSGEDLETVKNAKWITVSIGSNDILGVLIALLNSLPAGNGAEGQLSMAALAMLGGIVTSETSTAAFDEGVQSFRENLPLILQRLREMNPEAVIAITQLYNPYYGVKLGEFDFGGYADSYIRQMNDIIDTVYSETGGFHIAPVYEPFNAEGMTNVNLASFNFDPHPNKAGHQAIADAALSALNGESAAAIAPAVTTEAPLTETETQPESETETTSEINTEPDNENANENATENVFLQYGLAAIVTALAAVAAVFVIVAGGKKKNSGK